jgi:Bifunctional DNA primase/polymerase, N-terminal
MSAQLLARDQFKRSPAISSTEPKKRPTKAKRNAAFESVALQLYDNGYSPIPLADKEVRIAEWTKQFCQTRPTREDIADEWSVAYRGVPLNGVGIATYGNLIILDIETDAILSRTRSIIPNLDDAPACIGQKGRKVFLLLVGSQSHSGLNLSGAKTGKQIEVLAHGRQGAIPPTIHPETGKSYAWVDEQRTLLNTRLEDLPTITVDQVMAIHAAFNVEKEPRTPKAEQRAEIAQAAKEERLEKKVAAYIVWNDCPLDRARDLDAINRLDYNSRPCWLNVATAIAKKYGNHQPVWDGFNTWAEQWQPTGPVETTNAAMRANALANAAKGNGVTMAWVIHAAKKTGWDASIARWTGICTSKRAAAAPVTVPSTISSQIRREAHTYAATTDNTLTPLQIRLLNILRMFDNSEIVWPSIERLEKVSENTRDRIIRAMTELQFKGYIRTHGYGLAGGPRRLSKERRIEFTPPNGMTWDILIANRNYGVGCPLDELKGPHCSNDKDISTYSHSAGNKGGAKSAHVPNGTRPLLTVEGEGCVQRLAGKRNGQPEAAGMPETMSEESWNSLLDISGNQVASDKPAPHATPTQVSTVPDTPERIEADGIEPERRTNAQWLQSSWVPAPLSAIALGCAANKPIGQIAADLLRCHNQGIDPMDAFDAMAAAINATTWDHKADINHRLNAIRRSKPTASGRITLNPGEVLTRVRERFVIELDKAGFAHPDAEQIKSDRAERKARALAYRAR